MSDVALCPCDSEEFDENVRVDYFARRVSSNAVQIGVGKPTPWLDLRTLFLGQSGRNVASLLQFFVTIYVVVGRVLPAHKAHVEERDGRVL